MHPKITPEIYDFSDEIDLIPSTWELTISVAYILFTINYIRETILPQEISFIQFCPNLLVKALFLLVQRLQILSDRKRLSVNSLFYDAYFSAVKKRILTS